MKTSLIYYTICYTNAVPLNLLKLAVIDTALAIVRKESQAGNTLMVIEHDGTSKTVRAFGVLGRLHWPMICKPCSGTGKSQYDKCWVCSGQGKVAEP